MLLLSFFIFSSCSDEEDAIPCLPGIAELTEQQIGTYSGLLTLNGTEVLNLAGTATLILTDCKLTQSTLVMMYHLFPICVLLLQRMEQY